MHICRSTPLEVLHTILLGPYKYLLRQLMSTLNAKDKSQLRAMILTFPYSIKLVWIALSKETTISVVDK